MNTIFSSKSPQIRARVMEEALNLYLQEPETSNDIAVLPRKSVRKSKNIAEVPVDPEVAFSFMVRYHRIKKHKMTQNQAAKKMGQDLGYSTIQKKRTGWAG